MATTFAVSGQHYLFNVQSFAHTVLAQGGVEFDYSFRDRTTKGVIDDVASGASQVGVVVVPSDIASDLKALFADNGVEFHEICASAPQVALPLSHPLSNASKLKLDDLADWPYLCFEQESDDPLYAEEALGSVKRSKVVRCTDRASLTELCSALNGYTVTSGIFVGVFDGSSLTTIALDTPVKLHLGYLTRKDEELDPVGEQFVKYLTKCLERYAYN